MEMTTAIRDLQIMLDRLSYRFDNLPRLRPTGVFDERTLEAVMIFQRDLHPPVTGVVDEDTWNSIKDAYFEDLLQYGEPISLRVFPDGNRTYTPDGTDEPLLIAAAMMTALAGRFDNFSGNTLPNSISDDLRRLQSLSGLTENGILNRATWEFLSRLYHAFVTRDVGNFSS